METTTVPTTPRYLRPVAIPEAGVDPISRLPVAGAPAARLDEDD